MTTAGGPQASRSDGVINPSDDEDCDDGLQNGSYNH